jgi:photosystem II stability/assembly factor-like uncharacterized protein
MKIGPSLFLGVSLTAIAAFPQGTRLNHWKVIGPGGGGTTIGPTISPHDPSLVVEHCDMTGGYITYNNGQSWRMFNLRGGIEVFAFDPANDQVIYAGNAALWRSSDRGKSWSMLYPSPARHTLEHQTGDHAEYSLTSDDATYPGGTISAIAIDPRHPGHLFTAWERPSGIPGKQGGSATILFSSDNGQSWKKLTNLSSRVSLLEVNEAGLLAVSGSSAFRVTASGTPQELGRIPGKLKAVTAGHSGHDLWLYATNIQGDLFLSRDSGKTWKNTTPALGQSAGRFEAIAASNQHPHVAYAGFRGLQIGDGPEGLYNGIAKTTDGGQTWKIQFKESTHPAENLQGTWIEERARQNGEDIWFDSPYSLGVSPVDPNVAYATDLFRTYRTLDGGNSWHEVNSSHVMEDSWVSRGLDVTTDYGVQFDPFDQKHIYIDYTDIGLFQSMDGGSSWRSSTEGVPEMWRNTTYWLAFDPSVKGRVWGAFSGVHDLPRPKMFRSRDPLKYTGGVGVSSDGGLHWTPSGTGMPSTSVTHILLDPQSPAGNRTLYATAFGRGVYKSTDDGKTWTLKNNGIDGDKPFAWRITQADDGTLYLVVARRSEGKATPADGAGALYRSIDRAEHWQHVPLPDGVNGPTGLSLDPRNPRRMYLTAWGHEGDSADSGGGVYLSENGGDTWKALYTESQHVYDLTIDTRNPDTLYICGFDAAAYRSTDRGQHWTPIDGYNFKWGHRVIIDPADSSQIYITTYGGGVWHGPGAGDRSHQDVVTPVPVAH